MYKSRVTGSNVVPNMTRLQRIVSRGCDVYDTTCAPRTGVLLASSDVLIVCSHSLATLHHCRTMQQTSDFKNHGQINHISQSIYPHAIEQPEWSLSRTPTEPASSCSGLPNLQPEAPASCMVYRTFSSSPGYNSEQGTCRNESPVSRWMAEINVR